MWNALTDGVYDGADLLVWMGLLGLLFAAAWPWIVED